MPYNVGMDANKIIDELGGTSKTARLFDIKRGSVSGWRKHGIPKARIQTLRLLRPDLFGSKSKKSSKRAV